MDVIQIANIHNVKYEIPVEESPGFVVFTYENALLMIDKIRYECFPVAAIEVYIKRDFNFTCAFTCARRNGETMPQFTRRSCDEAIEYINNLNGGKNDYLYDIYVGDFDNVPMEVSEDKKELFEEDTRWSHKQILFAVLFADAIIAFCLNMGASIGLGIIYLSLIWAAVSGVIGLIFLPFKKLRDIGYVLVINVFLLPIVFFLCG